MMVAGDDLGAEGDRSGTPRVLRSLVPTLPVLSHIKYVKSRLQKSMPAQIRQLILYFTNIRSTPAPVDGHDPLFFFIDLQPRVE